MDDVESIPDVVLGLPTRRVFLLRRGEWQDGSGNRHEAGWALSTKAADVFDLEPGEYHEVDLPVVPPANTPCQNRRRRYLVKPALDILEAMSPIAGTVTFQVDGVQDNDYYLNDVVSKGLEGSAQSWVCNVDDSHIDSDKILARELADPIWRESYPGPTSAAAIAAAVSTNGGKLGCRGMPYPTDSSYGPLVDALEPYGVCIQDGQFVYDPPMATRRTKGRASRRKSLSTADTRAQKKRDDEKRLDEDELKTITHHHLRQFCASLVTILAEGAMRSTLRLSPAKRAYPVLQTFHEAWLRVDEAYAAWVEAGCNDWPLTRVDECIGGKGASARRVLEKVVERLTRHNAKVRQRAEDAGMAATPPRYLAYARSILSYVDHLDTLRAQLPAEPSEEDAT